MGIISRWGSFLYIMSQATLNFRRFHQTQRTPSASEARISYKLQASWRMVRRQYLPIPPLAVSPIPRHWRCHWAPTQSHDGAPGRFRSKHHGNLGRACIHIPMTGSLVRILTLVCLCARDMASQSIVARTNMTPRKNVNPICIVRLRRTCVPMRIAMVCLRV